MFMNLKNGIKFLIFNCELFLKILRDQTDWSGLYDHSTQFTQNDSQHLGNYDEINHLPIDQGNNPITTAETGSAVKIQIR